MKDYSLSKDEKKYYIINSKEKADGTLEVTFADGTVYKNIKKCDQNIKKIKDAQEKQANEAVGNYPKFLKDKVKARGYVIAGGIGGAIASSSLFLPAVHMDPVSLATAVGTIMLCSVLPGAVKLVRSNGKVKELDKIKYRNKHYEQLRGINKYENSLEGIDKSVAIDLKRMDEPFSVSHIDNYTIDDLKQIVNNIEREDNYNFIYKEKSKTK